MYSAGLPPATLGFCGWDFGPGKGTCPGTVGFTNIHARWVWNTPISFRSDGLSIPPPVHVQVSSCAPLGPRDVPEPRGHEHQRTLPVRERADHARASVGDGSTRQTELTETFPAHVVCEWLGNSRVIAQSHYLQVLDSHFEKAATAPKQEAAQIAAQHAAESSDVEMHRVQAALSQRAPVPMVTSRCEVVREQPMTPMGFEPMSRP